MTIETKMKNNEKKLTWERLTELFNYDPDTGEIIWKRVSHRERLEGKLAGTPHKNGYIQITVDGGRFLAHRLAWFYVYNCWPKDQIDHANRIKTDNRITNLREASNAENQQNQTAKGVRYHKGKYEPRITLDNKAIYLGLYKTEEEAFAVYQAAKRKYHPFCFV